MGSVEYKFAEQKTAISFRYLGIGHGPYRMALSRHMTELTFDTLRTAITLAKNENIGRLSAPRARLFTIYPGQEKSIQAAINGWSEYARPKS